MKKRSILYGAVTAVLILVFWEVVLPLIPGIPTGWLANFWSFLWGQKFGLAIGIIGTILVNNLWRAVTGGRRRTKTTQAQPQPQPQPRSRR